VSISAQARLRERGFPHQDRTPGNVERDASERLVHRRVRLAVAGDALLVAERLRDRLAQRDGAVLGRVVLVDMKIALHPHGHVDQRMSAELFDHVIEEADSGRNVIDARTVQIDETAMSVSAVVRVMEPVRMGNRL
jgi:hypothetical protein